MHMGLSTWNAYKGIQEYITQQYGLGVCIWDLDRGYAHRDTYSWMHTGVYIHGAICYVGLCTSVDTSLGL